MAVADPGLKQVVLRNSTWNGCLVYSAVKQLARGADVFTSKLQRLTKIMLLLKHKQAIRGHEMQLQFSSD